MISSMKFSISFPEKNSQTIPSEYIHGEISLGEFHEGFRASLSYWNTNNYLLQWREGLQRICDGNSKSCLVTSMYDPNSSNYIFLWLLYLNGCSVYVQNQILFLEGIDTSNFESTLYNYITDRETFNEDGNKISEWVIGLDDIKNYINSPDLDIDSGTTTIRVI